ncbi:hypothetical protein LXA43DRAFT_1104723 [Ganoderma leucocontextum]|nr:hypothetical protein LXA43DRAFT_1104723 [Ganoderma leucocontextum]
MKASQALFSTLFHLEFHRDILRQLSFTNLFLLRAVSRSAYLIVMMDLARDFSSILAAFLPGAFDFACTMKLFQVYLIGFHAVAFFNRERFREGPLELSVPRCNYEAVHEILLLRHCAVRNSHVYSEVEGVLTESIYTTSRGRILLLQSETDNALYPILHEQTSARMAYVGAKQFGLLWPSLSMKCRALAAALYDDDSSAAKTLDNMGYDVRLFAWQFSDLGPPQLCARRRFLCPSQPRYVDDAGSLLASWRLLSTPAVSTRLGLGIYGPSFPPAQPISFPIMSADSNTEPSTPDLEMIDFPVVVRTLSEEAYAPESIIVPLWVSKKHRRRLLRLSTYAHPASAAYALASVPPNATWGTGPFFSRYLCIDHDPATIYSLGTIHDLTFRLEAEKLPQLSISIDFLRNGDHENLTRLIKRARPRPVCIPARFSASPSLSDERSSFCEIFDATGGLRPKHEMEHVNLASLTTGDIVLLETSFVRKQFTDATWTVSFELEAVLVLVKAPHQ